MERIDNEKLESDKKVSQEDEVMVDQSINMAAVIEAKRKAAHAKRMD